MKKRYGKLVRDNIPAIIRANGEIPNIRTMDTDEYRRELLYKLIEEAEEVRKAGYDLKPGEALLKQVADLAEVFDATLTEFEITPEILATARSKRRKERGGFEGKIFLESVQ